MLMGQSRAGRQHAGCCKGAKEADEADDREGHHEPLLPGGGDQANAEEHSVVDDLKKGTQGVADVRAHVQHLPVFTDICWCNCNQCLVRPDARVTLWEALVTAMSLM